MPKTHLLEASPVARLGADRPHWRGHDTRRRKLALAWRPRVAIFTQIVPSSLTAKASSPSPSGRRSGRTGLLGHLAASALKVATTEVAWRSRLVQAEWVTPLAALRLPVFLG
jgi:hypothetical protein